MTVFFSNYSTYSVAAMMVVLFVSPGAWMTDLDTGMFSDNLKKENTMEIHTQKEANATVVMITGRLDAVTSPEYEKAVNELISSGEIKFVVDFEGLDYISSATSSRYDSVRQGKPEKG
jgi:hypothetical protein